MQVFSYTAKQKLKKALLVLGSLMAVFLVFCIGRFIYLERYVVYDESGVHLDYSGQISSQPQEETLPVGDFILQQESATGQAIDAPIHGQVKTLSGVYLTASQLMDDDFRSQIPTMLENADAVMLEMKTSTGKYLYPTKIANAQQSETDLSALIAELNQKTNLTLIAKIPAFSDSSYALADFSQALVISGGALWMNENGSYCLDPGADSVPGYLVSQVRELSELGFDEIVFEDFNFPNSPNIRYGREIPGTDATRNAAAAVAEQAALYEIPVSFLSADTEILARSYRAFIPAESGELVSALADEYSAILGEGGSRLVFLTDSRDTRFAEYSVLSPVEPQ